jgi:carbonic anhydrase
MSNLSDQAFAWIVAVGTSSAIFGGGSYVLVKAARRGNDHHATLHADSKHDEHSEHGGGHDKPVEHSGSHAAPHWSYLDSAKDGPAHWGDLAESFAACETGTTQSPIDIKNTVLKDDAPVIEFHYSPITVKVENNGHTIVASMPDAENHITIDQEKYTLAQFHFHNPSEHMFKGNAAEMELHLVHKNENGGLAVIGVMLNEEGKKENLVLQPIWNTLGKTDHDNQGAKNSHDEHDKKDGHGGSKIDLVKVLPKSRDFFHYAGSLTTPPCSEGVRWFVMKEAVGISAAQVQQYSKTFGGPTNRPVQPLHDREIIEGSGTSPLAH